MLVHLALGSWWSLRNHEWGGTHSFHQLAFYPHSPLEAHNTRLEKAPESCLPEVLDLVMDARHHKLLFFFSFEEGSPCGLRDLRSRLGIEPSTTVKAVSPNHWTTRDLLSQATLTGWVQQTFLGCIHNWTKQIQPPLSPGVYV